MKTKKEPRNLKVLNIIALLCAIGQLIYFIIRLIVGIVNANVDFSDLSVHYIISQIESCIFLVLTIAAVILNFRRKNGSVKVTVIALYLPLVYDSIYKAILSIHDSLTEKGTDLSVLLFNFLINFLVLYLPIIISAITSFSYIIKPKKFKLIISDILLVIYLLPNIEQLYYETYHAIHFSSVKDLYFIIKYATASLIAIFIMLVVNLSYKKVKIVNADNIEINSSNTSVVNNDLPETIKQYKALLDEGIITQEEYEKKKKELLGL